MFHSKCWEKLGFIHINKRNGTWILGEQISYVQSTDGGLYVGIKGVSKGFRTDLSLEEIFEEIRKCKLGITEDTPEL